MQTAFYKKYLTFSIITFVLLFNLVLGLARIGTYSAVDEPYWTYDRTPDFWKAVAAHKWRSTNINDKPGITVAIISGFGLLGYNPLDYKSLRDDVKTDAELAAINAINFDFRLPIFLFCTISLLFYYFFLKKLFNPTVAILGFIFIGLSPIIFGISLIINPDSLLWIFLPLSLLSFFVFQKNHDRRYLWATGFLLGLSLLTKYVANILYVFFFFLPFLDYIFTRNTTKITPYLKTALKNYAIIIGISMLTFFVLFPATWLSPSMLLEGTFLSKAFSSTWPIFAGVILFILADMVFLHNNVTRHAINTISRHKTALVRIVIGFFLVSIGFVVVNTLLGMRPFDLMSILASPKGIGSGNLIAQVGGAFSADIFSLVFGLTPIVFIGFIYALFRQLSAKTTRSREQSIIFTFSLFIIFYYLASTVNGVIATVRYQIILYPMACIIAAIGIASIIKNPQFKKVIPHTWAVIFCLGIAASSLFFIRPYYFSYASPLLPKEYLLNLKDMGDGSYEAAAYLNALPNARLLSIWSDKGAVCAVFVGDCSIGFSKKDLAKRPFDYFVVSTGRTNRSLKLSGSVNDLIDFRLIYGAPAATHTIIIGDRPNNSVRIISGDIIKNR